MAADGPGVRPAPNSYRLRLAPTSESESNALREQLLPAACWRMDDVLIEFESSIVLPGAAGAFSLLKVLKDAHTGAPISLFGHADPVGQDEYNKQLSGRRATAVYALLIRRTAMWEQLYSHAAGDDKWNPRALQVMLAHLGYSAGPPGDTMDDLTREGLTAFRRDQSLGPGATNDAATREKLFRAYMDSICKDLNGNQFVLDPATDFLGKGADAQGKGDYQGCGEFNPVLMFSATEDSTYSAASDKTARNQDNAPNRRVIGFLFMPGTTIDTARWPCPRASEGPAGCRKRFWSDSVTRRAFQLNRRTHEADHNTYACRFYERIAVDTPCSGAGATVTLRILFQFFPGTDGPNDQRGIRDVPYTLRVIGGLHVTGRTAADGAVVVSMVAGSSAVLDVMGSSYIIQPRSVLEALNTVQGVQRRLDVLGYTITAVDGTIDRLTDHAILQVQSDAGLATDGDPPSDTGTPSTALQTQLRNRVGS